ncbi:MAG: hypothetical protein AAF802_00450 [Planctomycetota bacterium]
MIRINTRKIGGLLAALAIAAISPTSVLADTHSKASSSVEFANEKCPMLEGKPLERLTTDYKGMTIGFCCEGCPEKWAALSDEEKAARFEKVKKSNHEMPMHKKMSGEHKGMSHKHGNDHSKHEVGGGEHQGH